MKSLLNITILILLTSLYSCEGKDFKYKIEGSVMAKSPSPYSFVPNDDTTKSIHSAVAYTDTIYGQNEDSIWYYNSNGSKLTLLAPYKVYKLK